MFKKLAIGCAVALVLLAVGGGIGMYWLYSKAKSYVGAVSQLGDVTEMEKQVANKASFTGPATGELTADQVDRFAKLNEQVQASLGPKFEQLRKRYDEMDARMRAESREASPAEAFAAVKDLAGIVKEVRAAQATALNAQRMSVDEYRWIRDRAYDAAGIPISVFNVGAFVDAAKSGDVEKLTKGAPGGSPGLPDVPEQNRTLVKPLEKRLEQWAAIAWLGF